MPTPPRPAAQRDRQGRDDRLDARLANAVATAMNNNQPQDDRAPQDHQLRDEPEAASTGACSAERPYAPARLRRKLQFTNQGLQVTAPHNYVDYGLRQHPRDRRQHRARHCPVNVLLAGLRVMPMFAVRVATTACRRWPTRPTATTPRSSRRWPSTPRPTTPRSPIPRPSPHGQHRLHGQLSGPELHRQQAHDHRVEVGQATTSASSAATTPTPRWCQQPRSWGRPGAATSYTKNPSRLP